MSTRCRIGITYDNNEVKSIYCHHDGYPQYMIPMLTEHYDTKEKVEELMDLGDLSCLEANINPTIASHSFDHPEDNVCVAYCRDRGEDPEDTRAIITALKGWLGGDEEYGYVFDHTKIIRKVYKIP